ncbi:hypothetical protein Fot_07534 [Forsythia ovata]|uniref:Maturase R n=1 Tax=Forsythia ovata TaxID=205694 RepID=A0ABD1WWT2_9LAMI
MSSCPSGVVESSGDRESISPRTHRVNLGLALEEMDLVEGWVEHVREYREGMRSPTPIPNTGHVTRKVPTFFLTEKDLAVISWLYSFKDFYGVIGSDHLFVKHNLMKKQGNRLRLSSVLFVYLLLLVFSKTVFCGLFFGSSALPKIGLAGLATKKIPPVIKRSLLIMTKRGLLLDSASMVEKKMTAASTSIDPKQTTLVPTILPRACDSWRKSKR